MAHQVLVLLRLLIGSWWPHAPPVEVTRERLKGSCAGALQRVHEREKTRGEGVRARNQRLPFERKRLEP